MAEGIQDILQESKRNKYSPIWNSLSETDVIAIWENVARFVEKSMVQQKGVSIPGLGTFTFSQVKLDVGNNKFLLLQRPVFVLSEKFVLTHGLRQNKHVVPGGIPVNPLNMSQLSIESPYDRDTVEVCVREIVNALGRSISLKGQASFMFSGIGRFQVHDLKFKMKFLKSFLNSMDGSGKIVETLQGRPGTADSVMSERCGSRLSRSEFYRKTKRFEEDDCAQLPVINEEEDGASDVIILEDHPCKDSPLLDEQDDAVKEFQMDEIDREDSIKSANHRIPLVIPEASIMSFTDDLHAIEKTHRDDRTSATNLQRPSTGLVLSTKHPTFSTVNGHHDNRFETSSLDFRTSYSALDDIGFYHEKIPSRPGTASSCGHSNSGQELCYLCHQRARRNVAISFADERRRKEEEEDEKLMKQQLMKANSEKLKEQEKLLLRRQQNQKVAAFNLGIAEAVAQKKNVKEDFNPSFIFQRRLLTPPQFLIQGRYRKELESQIAAKEAADRKLKMDDDFLGRLEQFQLAEEIAAAKAKRFKDKVEQQEEYRRALSAQLKLRSEPIPGSVSPSSEPYFGRNDADDEKMAEKRKKAHELFREQVATVEQKKREELLRRIEEQRRDESTLLRIRQEYISDAASKYDTLIKNRKNLEADWKKAADAKRERDAEQRIHDKVGCKLMHEQCDKYKRCRQCKRRLENVGETNVWCETLYVPGTRIMT